LDQPQLKLVREHNRAAERLIGLDLGDEGRPKEPASIDEAGWLRIDSTFKGRGPARSSTKPGKRPSKAGAGDGCRRWKVSNIRIEKSEHNNGFALNASSAYKSENG